MNQSKTGSVSQERCCIADNLIQNPSFINFSNYSVTLPMCQFSMSLM